MQILEHVSLKSYNTFGLDTTASHFVSIQSIDDLKKALSLDYPHKFIIGGGSNMLLKADINGLVMHIALKGIAIVNETEDNIFLKVAAGENWHQFVRYCIDHNYGGVENLSLIPGNTGTAPIQNIGAYGVELKDVFYECNTVDRKTLEEKTFGLTDCNFGYRDSIFKNEAKDKYIITSVTFKLTKRNHHINIAYGDIKERLLEQGITQPTIEEVSDTVIAIRQSKLPNPEEIGNSGSFFKNPYVDRSIFLKLRKTYVDLPFYPISSEINKIPAGWLIEKAGFKGIRVGDAGVHDKQALVLVNHGAATGSEIWDLALKIQATIANQFGITLQPEVNILG